MEAEGVFEKTVNIQPEVKAKLDTKIDALTGLTDEQKKDLREAMYQFSQKNVLRSFRDDEEQD